MICCIFGGAEIEDYGSVNVPEGAVVIAADGGYRHCIRLGIKPDCIVGDFDSYDEKLPDDCKIIRAPCEKDDTDLLLAVKIGFENNISSFYIYGADGGRMGHTFAAIQTLSYIESCGGEGVIFGRGYTMRVQGRGRKSYCNDGYRYVSVFSLTDRSHIIAKGLKYGGEIHLTSTFPMGVSNEFISDSAEIEVLDGKILVISEK